MRWIRTIAVGLAAALTAIALSVGLVTADDCNQPAPDDFRSDVAWDGTGLHHQPQDVQDLFSRVWGTDDDLHVRTWAWQHNCRTQPRESAGDPADESTTTDDQDADDDSSGQSGGGREKRPESGVNMAHVATRSPCHGQTRPNITTEEVIQDGAWIFCNAETRQWFKARRVIPGVDYAADHQLVAPGVGNCADGQTHYDPISKTCMFYPDGPDV